MVHKKDLEEGEIYLFKAGAGESAGHEWFLLLCENVPRRGSPTFRAVPATPLVDLYTEEFDEKRADQELKDSDRVVTVSSGAYERLYLVRDAVKDVAEAEYQRMRQVAWPLLSLRSAALRKMGVAASLRYSSSSPRLLSSTSTNRNNSRHVLSLYRRVQASSLLEVMREDAAALDLPWDDALISALEAKATRGMLLRCDCSQIPKELMDEARLIFPTISLRGSEPTFFSPTDCRRGKVETHEYLVLGGRPLEILILASKYLERTFLLTEAALSVVHVDYWEELERAMRYLLELKEWFLAPADLPAWVWKLITCTQKNLTDLMTPSGRLEDMKRDPSTWP